MGTKQAIQAAGLSAEASMSILSSLDGLHYGRSLPKAPWVSREDSKARQVFLLRRDIASMACEDLYIID